MGNQKISILLEEYKLHRNELVNRFDHRVKGVSFIYSALIIALGISEKDGVGIMYVGIPVFLLGFLAYYGHQYICSTAQIEYLKRLENQLEYLNYQSSFIPNAFQHSKRVSNPYNGLILIQFLPLIIVSFYCTKIAHVWFDSVLIYIVYCFFVALFFILIGLFSYLGIRSAKKVQEEPA